MCGHRKNAAWLRGEERPTTPQGRISPRASVDRNGLRLTSPLHHTSAMPAAPDRGPQGIGTRGRRHTTAPPTWANRHETLRITIGPRHWEPDLALLHDPSVRGF